MTAQDAIRMVEAAGGRLTLDGQRLHYRVPNGAEGLIDTIRDQKQVIVDILQQRAHGLANSWIGENCVGVRNAATGARILYREYYDATLANGGALDYDTFLDALEARGWYPDEDGMVGGMMLAADFLAAIKIEADAYGKKKPAETTPLSTPRARLA